MSRAKNPTPEHYYEEYMYKKDVNDKVYKKLWVGLLGNSLCFYSNHKDLRRVDCVCLKDFLSIKESTVNMSANASSEYLFSLYLTDREVQFKTESLESREMWRAYIITMAELSIPPSLTLLPGPLLALKEALEKEKQKQSQVDVDEMPSCFYNVSRMEAETLLKENPEFGNLLLRPGGNQQSISVTTCQQNQRNFVLKHYRVTEEQNRFVIQVEPRVACLSLVHVISHFVKSSHNLLIPFEKNSEYENRIGIIQVNDEDGEVTIRYGSDTPDNVQITHTSNVPPPLPRDPLPQEEYENPNEDHLPQRTLPEAEFPSKRRMEGPPFQQAHRLRAIEMGRNASPIMNAGLDEELRKKLQIRRAQMK
ncbi:signal-transducing adaptor protein 2 [Pelodytes ibericus]